jgi:uncharacterized protein
VGVHQDGLVHISQMADRFVKDPSEIVKVQQNVQVTVMDVDLERNRISLSMKKNPDAHKTGENAKKRDKKRHAPKRTPKKPPDITRPNKTQPESAKKKNTPFNNPFAELLKNR